MDELKLLTYKYELVDILDYEDYYYANVNRFTGFSKKAFLKSIDIPPSYFLEQPEDTQTTLLSNKRAILGSRKKYLGKSIVVLSDEDGIILNCARVDRDEALRMYEWLKPLEDVEGIFVDNTFHKDGYIVLTKLLGSKDKVQNAVFVNVPVLLNKDVSMAYGHTKLTKDLAEDTDVDIDNNISYYVTDNIADQFEYQHIAVALEDFINGLEEEENEELFNTNQYATFEFDNFVADLVEKKILPKNLFTPIVTYLSKEFEFDSAVKLSKLAKIILYFSSNLTKFKQVDTLRSNLSSAMYTFKDSSKEEKEEVTV